MTIENIIKKIEKRKDFYPKSTDKESALLLTLLTRMTKAQHIIEIGTYLGYGTLHMLKGMSNPKHIWTVDWKLQTVNYFNLLPNNLKKIIQVIQGTAKELHTLVPSNNFVDLIFIDANHTYTWVLHDLRYTLPYIKNGTYLIFHDALNPNAPGVHACTRLFHLVNLLCLNRAVEIIHIPTITTAEGETSGIALIRIKTNSKFLHRYVQQFFIFFYWLNTIQIFFQNHKYE